MSFAKARAAKRVYDVLGDLSGEKLLTPSEIERRFGISRRQVGRLVERGALQPIRTGVRYRIASADLRRFLAGAHT